MIKITNLSIYTNYILIINIIHHIDHHHIFKCSPWLILITSAELARAVPFIPLLSGNAMYGASPPILVEQHHNHLQQPLIPVLILLNQHFLPITYFLVHQLIFHFQQYVSLIVVPIFQQFTWGTGFQRTHCWWWCWIHCWSRCGF